MAKKQSKEINSIDVDHLYFNEFIELDKDKIPSNENYYVRWTSKILETDYYFHVMYVFDKNKVKNVLEKWATHHKEDIYFSQDEFCDDKEQFCDILTFESTANTYKQGEWHTQRSYTARFGKTKHGGAILDSAKETSDFLSDITKCIIGIDIKDIQDSIERITCEIRFRTEWIDDYNKILKETLDKFHYYD